MTSIEELQTRITRALDRIAYRVEGFDPLAQSAPVEVPETAAAPEPQAADPAELAQLRDALEDERLTNAQLTERVRVLREKVGNEQAELREQIEAQREGMARLDADLQRLRQANDALRRANDALREANARGVGEPHLINKAMLAELEALRAARAAEAAEVELIHNALIPLLGGAVRAADPQKEVTE